MSELEFIDFNQVYPDDFLLVVNEQALRTHLVDHAYFDSISIKEWMEDKAKTESLPDCRIRAIYIDGVLAGWCGIQPDDNGFELAIVISQKFWGFGISIFKTLMCWAKELGHKEIIFHLLDSRPNYQSLKRLATKVQKTELMNRCFTTYYFSVDKWRAE